MKDVIGFGEGSRHKTTTTRNAYVRVTTRPVFNGAEVIIECLSGMMFADGARRKTLELVRGKRETEVANGR